MATKLTSKGQVTIPKSVRDALQLGAGSEVEFAVNGAGEIVIRKHGRKPAAKNQPTNRFEALRGSAQIKWDTDELMKLLRG